MTISYRCTRTDSLVWMASDHFAESIFDHVLSEGGAADKVNALGRAALDHVSPE